jgi:transposase
VNEQKTPPTEVVQMPRPGRRRRFSAEEKRRLLELSDQPGESISSVARQYGVAPSLMFKWRRLLEQGAQASLEADEPTVAESEVKELKARVRELERMLGRKTMEVEILQEAVRIGREKKLISRAPLLPRGSGR